MVQLNKRVQPMWYIQQKAESALHINKTVTKQATTNCPFLTVKGTEIKGSYFLRLGVTGLTHLQHYLSSWLMLVLGALEWSWAIHKLRTLKKGKHEMFNLPLLQELKGYTWQTLIREPKRPINAISSIKSTLFLIRNSWNRQVIRSTIWSQMQLLFYPEFSTWPTLENA